MPGRHGWKTYCAEGYSDSTCLPEALPPSNADERARPTMENYVTDNYLPQP
jgi:hypothetical protein